MLVLDGLRTLVTNLAFAPDGLFLAATVRRSCAAFLFDLPQRRLRPPLQGHEHRVVSLAFAPRGDLLASIDSLGGLRYWSLGQDAGPPHPPRSIDLRGGAEPRLAFSPDGSHLACPLGWNVAFWKPGQRGTYSVKRTGHANDVSCVTFSPDGVLLATGSFDRSVRLFDLIAGKPRWSFEHGRKVHHLAFSPDGATLASGSPDGLIKLWDMGDGKKRSVLTGQAKPLHAIAFSPDGRVLGSAAGDGTVRFWDVSTGRGREAFDWGIGAVHAVAFAPDGMRAAAGGEGKVVVWDVEWEG